MQIIGDIFNTIFYQPTVNLLVLIYHGLSSLHIPGALGFSIIILTILIRILVWPFMATQLKSAKKMADLKPHLDKLKEKHQGDKQALANAQMALYKEHGVNPAGGCLPTLIQFPVLIALYQSIYAFFNGPDGLGNINHLLYLPAWHLSSVPDLNFFGLNLAVKPFDLLKIGPSMFPIALIPLLTAGLQLIQSRMMMPAAIKEYPSDSAKEKKEKESIEDSMGAVQSQMMYMMPLMIGYFSFQFPLALSLYWNTLTLVGIYQQHRIGGWGSFGNLVAKVSPRR